MHQHFKYVFGCYICNKGLQIIMFHLKTPFSETHSKTYLHCEKLKKREYMRMLNVHINIFKTCTALQNHVKAMHTGHLQQYFKYFLLNLSNLRQLLSVTHLIIFALEEMPETKSVPMIMLQRASGWVGCRPIFEPRICRAMYLNTLR